MTHGMHLVPCDGTPRYPGCGKHFAARDRRARFCPECTSLDRARSFVFVERRRALEAQRERQEEEP